MNTKSVYHYVYRITNIVENKHYYGKRTSKQIEPKFDLGIRYFSSSKDKEFILDQKNNSQNYKYKVVRILNSSKEAIALEIKLHNKFDVGTNFNFYNKAKQTSVGFNTAGVEHTLETRSKISLAGKNRKHTQETKKKMSITRTGKIQSEEHKNNISKGQKGKILSQEHKDKMSAANKGKIFSQETKEKMSAAQKGRIFSQEHKDKIGLASRGIKHYNAKLANIYNYYTDELIAAFVIIKEWCKINSYDASHLSVTARADRTLPNSRANPHQHKGIYAIYLSNL